MTSFRSLPKSFLITALLATGLSAPALADTAATTEAACDAAMMRGSLAQLSASHATIYSAIRIDAAPAEVWAILTDFERMAEWSSATLQNMTGDIRHGGAVEITFLFGEDAEGKPVVNTIPHQLIFRDGAHFGWSDPFPTDIGGGHDNHLYRVEPCGETTLFVQSDEIVDNPYAATFAAQLLPLYQRFNAELKAEVEKR